MACLDKMKALKTPLKRRASGQGKKQKKKNPHIKRPYLASSQGVLALAFNGLWPNSPIQINGFRFLDFGLLVCLDKRRTFRFV